MLRQLPPNAVLERLQVQLIAGGATPEDLAPPAPPASVTAVIQEADFLPAAQATAEAKRETLAVAYKLRAEGHSLRSAVETAAQGTGVLMSKTVLLRFIQDNGPYLPGRAIPAGARKGDLPALSDEIERKVAHWLELQDAALVPMTDRFILAHVAAVIKGTPYAAKFKAGVPTKGWLVRFRKRHNFITLKSRPLEGKRAEWRKSENAMKMYMLYEDLLVERGIAKYTPDWDETKPRTQRVAILHPSRIAR